MNKRTISLFSLILLAVLVATILVSCGGPSATISPSGGTDGASLMQNRCSVCHTTSRITSAHKTSTEWASTVQRMIDHGAQLSAAEKQTLVDYLAANYK